MHASISPTRPLSLLCLPSIHGFDSLFHPRLIRVKKKERKKERLQLGEIYAPLFVETNVLPSREKREREREAVVHSRGGLNLTRDSRL